MKDVHQIAKGKKKSWHIPLIVFSLFFVLFQFLLSLNKCDLARFFKEVSVPVVLLVARPALCLNLHGSWIAGISISRPPS